MKETLEIIGWIGVAAFTLTQLKIYDVAADLRARKWIPEQAEIHHDTPPMSPASPSISPSPTASPSLFSLTASPSPSSSASPITIQPN